jgi:predicted nucleic acid-binding protein
MIRALLDTDVLLDLLLDRAPFSEAATAIWDANKEGLFEGYLSAITPLNIFFIARKLKGADTARQAVSEVLGALRVCPVDVGILWQGLALPFKDYEDAVQHASAVQTGVDMIVTRNLDDYRGEILPVFSPDDFLKKL